MHKHELVAVKMKVKSLGQNKGKINNLHPKT